MLPWLWYRPAAAALIQPLVWEIPHATGAALKKPKTKRIGAGTFSKHRCLVLSSDSIGFPWEGGSFSPFEGPRNPEHTQQSEQIAMPDIQKLLH